MKHLKTSFIFSLLLLTHCVFGQDIVSIKGPQITQWKGNTSDTLYVINFWATWCKPCVEEMPAFEKLIKESEQRKVKVILVSNDFKKQIESKLIPFVKQHQIENQVVFMDESNPNNWIELVDPNWSGAIPATLFVLGSKKLIKFHEGIMSYQELLKTVNQMQP